MIIGMEMFLFVSAVTHSTQLRLNRAEDMCSDAHLALDTLSDEEQTQACVYTVS